MFKNIVFIAIFVITINKSNSQTAATDYYPWSTLTFTVNAISEYDDDNSVLVQLKDQYNGGANLWMPKSETSNLSLLLSAKLSGLSLMAAWDTAPATTRTYNKEPTVITAFRLKKMRIY